MLVNGKLYYNMNNNIRPIAFYLPQFYPTKENDLWWEPGFTEWTNVARAKPLFHGHYQPRLPRDLGFYDLRVPETREKQVQMAKEAGIEGFCYWHYWFGNGKRLLSEVFHEVVTTGKPDFPFCLCWANHSWFKKTWDPTKPNTLLIEQTYLGVQDYEAHFYEMLPAFKDERYMKVDGKLIFGVFAPNDIPDTDIFFTTWNRLASENGLEGFHFFALAKFEKAVNQNYHLYDSIVYDSVGDVYFDMKFPALQSRWRNFVRKVLHKVYPVSYRKYIDFACSSIEQHPTYVPCINPDFDHTPRSGVKALALKGSSPILWGELCRKASALILKHHTPHNLLFIKAWNEWAEGNYLEPDRKWGTSYLDETRSAFTGMQSK